MSTDSSCFVLAEGSWPAVFLPHCPYTITLSMSPHCPCHHTVRVTTLSMLPHCSCHHTVCVTTLSVSPHCPCPHTVCVPTLSVYPHYPCHHTVSLSLCHCRVLRCSMTSHPGNPSLTWLVGWRAWRSTVLLTYV